MSPRTLMRYLRRLEVRRLVGIRRAAGRSVEDSWGRFGGLIAFPWLAWPRRACVADPWLPVQGKGRLECAG